jgi:hypothetical protein
VAGIATDARANLAGVNVVSVGPLVAEQEPGGVQYSVVVIVPNKTGNDFGSSYVMLDIARDPFMATVYRTALIIALEEFFARFSTLAKYCQKEWPSEYMDRAVAELMRERSIN